MVLAMSNVTDLPTDRSMALSCLRGALEEAAEYGSDWAIVILPNGDETTILASHQFSHVRLCGLLKEAECVSLLSDIEATMSE